MPLRRIKAMTFYLKNGGEQCNSVLTGEWGKEVAAVDLFLIKNTESETCERPEIDKDGV